MHSVLILVATFTLVASLEASFALAPKFFSNGEHRARRIRNLVLGVLMRAGYAPFLAAPAFVFVAYYSPWARGPLGNGVVGWIFDFLLLDFVGYATHVMAHQNPLLWRFHSVHHLDQELDATTALRTHFGEKILTLPLKLLAVSLFAVPLSHLAVAELVFFMNGIFHHANLRIPRKVETALSYVFTMPAFHAVHHHGDLPYTDSNYGFLFTFWDAIFGTVSRRERDPQQGYGINERVRGRFPESITELLLQPVLGPLSGTTLVAEVR